MKKDNTFFILCVVGMLAFAMPSQAAFDRSLDPVIVLGSECASFVNKEISGVRVYVFDAAAGAWTAVPLQVDEFQIKNGTVDVIEVVWQGDGIFTAKDELVFMAKDMKDQAPNLATWPNDAVSKTNQRYEIVCTDPTTGEKAYAYVYYSATLPKSNVSYIQYRNDRIYTDTYGMAHHSEVASGFADSLAVVGNNVDILENVRVRAKIKKLVVNAAYGGVVADFTGTNIHFWEKMKDYNIAISYNFLTLNVKATAFHDVSSLKIKAGPIRVIRQHTLGVRFVNTLAALDDTSRIPIITLYYDKFSELKPAFSFTVGGDVKALEVEYISFSQAFNSASTNVKFYGNGFFSGTSADSLINKSPANTIFKKNLSAADWPGQHWFGFSGQQTSQINNASFLTFCILAGQRIAPATAPALFYFDYKDSFPDNSIPVYGDAGLQIYDWKKTTAEPTFAIDSRFRNYYFAKNSTRYEFQQLFNKYSQPVQLASTAQAFPDVIPPTRITDLRIIAATDTSMTLAWTAPYDDGDSGGPAAYYVMRYSEIAPANPVGDDYTWWGAPTTTTIQTPPAPLTPGATQTYVVTGLQEAKIYHFRINVVDDAVPTRNASGLSNTATMTTTPVELAAFTAQVLPSRQVLLQWTTESETNNLGFQIQRRGNQQVWQPVAFIPGFGTTVEQHQYSFTDTPTTPGEWFYRLKQKDTDGASEFSDEISVFISAPKVFELAQNYPNPFNPSTTLTFQIPDNTQGRMTLTIYDMLGRQIRALVNAEAEAGYYTLTWDGRDDSGRLTGSGVYIYQLRAGGLNETKKMIKVQ